MKFHFFSILILQTYYQGLRYLNLTTVTNDECRQRIRNSGSPGVPVHDNDTLCAFSGIHGHGICDGENTGGPLVFGDELIGLITWTSDCKSGPNGEVPATFTRVTTYLEWIFDVIKSNS